MEVMDIELQNLPLTSTKNDLDNDIVQKEDVIKKYQQEVRNCRAISYLFFVLGCSRPYSIVH